MKHDHSHDVQPSSSKLLNEDVVASTQTTLLIAGVDCSEEVAAVESALKATGHVREIKVSILGGKATIQHDGELSDPELIQTLKAVGLTALVKRNGEVTEVELSEVATDETTAIKSTHGNIHIYI